MSLAVVLVAVGASLPTACHLVLEDIDPSDDPPTTRGGRDGKGGATSKGGTSAVGGSTSSSSPFCPGDTEFYCKDNVLIDCLTGESTPCRSAGLCRSTVDAPRCLECASGEVACEGNVLKRCNADLDGWVVVQTCSGATPVCDVDNARCVVCDRADTKCQGTSLYGCNTDRSGWSLRRNCSVLVDPRGCVTVDARNAHCVDCNADYVPICLTSTTVQYCDNEGLVPNSCPNGCVDATGTEAAYCR
ncbi:MAG: hypothetical protein QM784_03530 [Polyangiaceae bacterium]